MRVKTLDIEGFRAFAGSHQFDLDADTVLVSGVNGQGKTSFFDAILWAITGQVPRLERPSSVVSMYSPSGEARVEVSIASNGGPTIVVTRRSDGERDRLRVTAGDDVFSGSDAEHQLIRRLWPEGLKAQDPLTALRSALQHSVYLQQDLLTGFLTAETDQQRFDAVSELIGAGVATELQASLESSRRAWSRATNVLESAANETENRLSQLEAQLHGLGGSDDPAPLNSQEWADWWAQIRDLGVEGINVPAPEPPGSPAALDAAIAELRTLRLAFERRREDLRALETAFLRILDVNIDVNELIQEGSASAEELEIARQNLSESERIVSDAQQLEAEAQSERQELFILAEVALRHLDDHCPVCLQTYDRDATRARLEALLDSGNQNLSPGQDLPDLPALRQRVQELERGASEAAAALLQAQRQQQLIVEDQDRIRLGLAELDVAVPLEIDLHHVIDEAIQETDRTLDHLSTARARGETLALSLARAGQLARKTEIEQQVQQINNELRPTRIEIDARRNTGELISKMIDGIRRASSDLVENELRRTEPLLERIYATVDPHPEFRVARLISRMRQGHGRIVAEVVDPIRDLRDESPRSVLSSSQLNVLAVAVFLSLNLGTHSLPLRTAILDDPLQSLDDLNLLGLMDLLKRLREKRQLMVSTHDSRFASLLERKLRPISDSQRTVRVELSGWSSEGPVVDQFDVEPDMLPIRMAAA